MTPRGRGIKRRVRFYSALRQGFLLRDVKGEWIKRFE